MMLGYYRNPLNQIFFNEGIVLVALQSFGQQSSWTDGVVVEELFTRSCFLARLLEKEEVQKYRITDKNREYFDSLLKVMLERKILLS